jgi:hypothetical protein
MHERCHLVALDKPFSQRFPLFIVRLSILNVITPLWCLDHQNPMQYLYLDLHRVLFFSFFFFKLSTWSSFHVHLCHHGLESCSTLGLYQLWLLYTLSIKVSTRVSSISQNQTKNFQLGTPKNTRLAYTPGTSKTNPFHSCQGVYISI